VENTFDPFEFPIKARQESNGRWKAWCYLGRGIDGKRLEVKRRGKTLAEARAKVLNDLAVHMDGREPAPRRTVAMAVDDWLPVALSRETGRGPLTLNARKQRQWLANLIKEDRLAGMSLEKLSTGEPVQACLDRHADKLSRDSLLRLRRMLGDVFDNEARHGRWTRPNWGTLAIIPPKARRKSTPSVLSLSQAQQFLESVEGTDLEAAWRLQAIYGLRPGEVRGLRASNVVIDHAEPHVRIITSTTTADNGVEVVGPLKRNHHRGRCPLDEHTAFALRIQFERLEFMESESGLMFPSSTDTLIDKDTYRRRFRTALKQAEIPNPEHYTPYNLRHTCATLLQEVYGWNLIDIAAHLRHRGLGSVNTYLQPDAIQMKPSPIAG
jgi:integrase